MRPLSNLQVSVARARRSSDHTHFVRSHIAKYFVSLLICNIVQSFGGILNIPWIIENRVYSGAACTAQGALKQLGNVRTYFWRRRTIIHNSHYLSLEQGFSVL